MTVRLHRGLLSERSACGDVVAIDTETLGLNPHRDRLCVVQVSPGDGSADVVQIPAGKVASPNLVRLLSDPKRLKLFHFARFDLAVLYKTYGVMAGRGFFFPTTYPLPPPPHPHPRPPRPSRRPRSACYFSERPKR